MTFKRREHLGAQKTVQVALCVALVIVSLVQFQLLHFSPAALPLVLFPSGTENTVPSTGTEKTMPENNEQKKKKPNPTIITPTKQRPGLKRLPGWNPDNPSQNSPQIPTGGAFVHLGKTGGSTLSLLLRNGCHSFMKHPCRTVAEPETPASRLISSYYHVPDFAFLQQSRHDFILITSRDPYDRTVSAFCYEHILNRDARHETVDSFKRLKFEMAYSCFPTLDAFAVYLKGNSTDFHYPYHQKEVHPESCVDLARAALFGKVKLYNHFFFGFTKIKSFLQHYTPVYYVARQEALWHDWETVNQLLLQQLPPDQQSLPYDFGPTDQELANRRNTTVLEQSIHLPVTRTLREEGVAALCKALEQEYKAYFWFLTRAKNLKSDDLEFSIHRAKERCGEHLDLDALVAAASELSE
jgi:hypothetical protein